MHLSTPPLGVGCVLLPGLERYVEAGQRFIDVLEIEPQTYWFAEASAYRIADDQLRSLQQRPQHKLIHGVGLPLAGSCPPEQAQLAPFIEMIETLGAVWASEHLSFRRISGPRGSEDVGFLLPPLQSEAGVALCVANLRALQAQLPVPLAFETGVNYLRPQPGELRDGAFWRAVAEGADCGILLDLHNLWCNAVNGRQSLESVLAELPLERVWEVHLAGGQRLGEFWLDAHSNRVPPALMALAREVLPALPNLKALNFELIPDYAAAGVVSETAFCRQMAELQELWAARFRPARTDRWAVPAQSCGALPTPQQWEQALAQLVRGLAPGDPLARRLASDPGIAVFAQLIRQVRYGAVAEALTLSFRYLCLLEGEPQFRRLMDGFCRSRAPQPFGLEEARAFVAFLERAEPRYQPVVQVARFEIACLEALCQGRAGAVAFDFAPEPVLRALGQGRLPAALTAGRYELEILP